MSEEKLSVFPMGEKAVAIIGISIIKAADTACHRRTRLLSGVGETGPGAERG